jgi:hypothetical protein
MAGVLAPYHALRRAHTASTARHEGTTTGYCHSNNRQSTHACKLWNRMASHYMTSWFTPHVC